MIYDEHDTGLNLEFCFASIYNPSLNFCKTRLKLLKMRRFILPLALVLWLIPPVLWGETGAFARESENMVLIPEGKFEMGSRLSLIELDPADLFNTDRHALGPEDPAHEVLLNAFSIDMYEVNNQEYMEYVEQTRAKNPAFMDDPNFNGARQPVVGVTWKQAKKYCEWRKKRLPTEAEWEKAARGKRPVRYPWGDQPPDSSRLNYNNEKQKTVPGGSYEAGKSDYGVYDLSGNVAEWVNDWHLPEYYVFSPKANPPGPDKGQYKVIRGGNWRNNAEDVRLTYRNATVPKLKANTVGFRCVKDAD